MTTLIGIIGGAVATIGLVTLLRGIQPTHTDTRLVASGGALFAVGAVAAIFALAHNWVP